jgi:hypothetical protein
MQSATQQPPRQGPPAQSYGVSRGKPAVRGLVPGAAAAAAAATIVAPAQPNAQQDPRPRARRSRTPAALVADALTEPGAVDALVARARACARRPPRQPGSEGAALVAAVDAVRTWAAADLHLDMSFAELVCAAQSVGGCKAVKAKVAQVREMEFRGVFEHMQSSQKEGPKKRRRKAQKVVAVVGDRVPRRRRDSNVESDDEYGSDDLETMEFNGGKNTTIAGAASVSVAPVRRVFEEEDAEAEDFLKGDDD